MPLRTSHAQRALLPFDDAFGLEGSVLHKLAYILAIALSLSLPAAARAQRLEGGGFITGAFLERIGSSDHRVGTSTMGLGGRAAVRLLPGIDLDGELAVHPNAGVQGYKLEGFLGAKAGVRWRGIGAFVKARPGFLYFSKDPFGAGRPGAPLGRIDWATSLDPSVDVGAVIEGYTRGGTIVRFDLGDTIVNYHARTVFLSQTQPAHRVGGFTARNRRWSLGVSKRF